MKRLIVLALSLSLAGCASSVNVPVLESETLETYNTELAKVSKTVRATKVELAHESGNKYVGYADLNDGTRVKLDVTYDGTKLVYRAY